MGRVAGSGAPEAFETFVAALGRWFAMQVFSPAPGQFVATFENITARRQGEDPGSGQVCPERRPAVPQAAPVPNKVLLVDDDEDVRFLMARMLRRGGVPQVETASGGEEAMDCLAQGTIPDVIILDQNMPGMTGVQALGRIRRLHPDIPVLFSSGQPDLPEKGCLDQAKVAVIGKPFTLAELQAKISQFDPL
jgi:CheY-like chemotaxis protein